MIEEDLKGHITEALGKEDIKGDVVQELVGVIITNPSGYDDEKSSRKL